MGKKIQPTRVENWGSDDFGTTITANLRYPVLLWTGKYMFPWQKMKLHYPSVWSVSSVLQMLSLHHQNTKKILAVSRSSPTASSCSESDDLRGFWTALHHPPGHHVEVNIYRSDLNWQSLVTWNPDSSNNSLWQDSQFSVKKKTQTHIFQKPMILIR